MTDKEILIASILAGFLAGAAISASLPHLNLPSWMGRKTRWAITIVTFLIGFLGGQVAGHYMRNLVWGGLTVARDTGANQMEDNEELDGFVNKLKGG